VYDRHETQTDDIELLRRLVGGRGPWRVLEPFCGTGRILIPLALDGHELVGLDQSQAMLDRARAKIAEFGADVRHRIALHRGDATSARWPRGFDLVVLGGNCFYELACPEEQEACVAAAAKALKPGGYVYVDNDHMEGELDESWRAPGRRASRFPDGVCADGTRVQGTSETIWCNPGARLWRAIRGIILTFPDGTTKVRERIQQKHPVSFGEVQGWLTKQGFAIEHTFGDHAGHAYTVTSSRATFWARKPGDAP
jgi:SAM-dependent methyltransferase